MRVLLALCLSVVCALIASESRAQKQPPTSALFSSTVYIIVDAQIKGTEGRKKFFGSGVLVSPDGYVLTAAHILPDLVEPENYVDVQVFGVVGTKNGYPVQLERPGLENAGVDVAFLKFPSGVSFQAAQTSTTPVAQDSFITITGFPLGLDLNILHGRVSSLNGPKGTWVTDTKVQEGSSGSPVFDAYGQLIGIATGGFQEGGLTPNPLGLNIIVPIEIAKSVASGLRWQGGSAAQHPDCQLSPVTVTGDQAAVPASASVPLDRRRDPSNVAASLAALYPWLIVDGATITVDDSNPTTLRFCKLELRNQGRIKVKNQPLFIITDYLVSADGKISSDPVETLAAPLNDAAQGGPGRAGKPGSSSGSVLLAVVLQLDGVLSVDLHGGHGFEGGMGGVGLPGAAGSSGVGGSDSLFDCRRGPGDGERGLTGGQGAAGGTGGPGGNSGNLQVLRLQATILPVDAVIFEGRGGRGGPGGLGGSGGPGGPGGFRGAQTTYCRGGNDGPRGSQGSNGVSGGIGPDGLDGTMRSSVVLEQDMVNRF